MEILISIIISIFIFLYYILWGFEISKSNNKTDMAPPPPPHVSSMWPIIGHLIGETAQVPYRTLASMADKNGPIFTIRLGVSKLLVVSDQNLAKECFTTNDKTFANRPKSIAGELMCYNHTMLGLDQYGPYWHVVKKMVVKDVLSKRCVATFEHIRVSQVRASLKESYEIWKSGNNEVVKFEMKEWFGRLVFEMVLKMVIGERYSSKDRVHKFEKAMNNIVNLLTKFVIGDAISWLRWFDIGGYEREMKESFKEIDSLLQEALDEHKKFGDYFRHEKRDFMDMILSSLDGVSEAELAGNPDVIAKATCLAMLLGGVETTIVTLTWTLSLLLKNKHALKMVQKELDLHVGKDRQLEESDLKHLVYLQSVVKETLRLYAPAPFALPHEATENCMVGGYQVSRGTRLFVNIWKIHHDPEVWSDPNEFQPERFLNTHKNVDYKGQNFALIPFGSGRRLCPGISLATQNIHLILASLIHGFDVTNLLDEKIDMTESFGTLLIQRAKPLEVFLSPRISHNLYI